jgi:hypothetical protein
MSKVTSVSATRSRSKLPTLSLCEENQTTVKPCPVFLPPKTVKAGRQTLPIFRQPAGWLIGKKAEAFFLKRQNRNSAGLFRLR